jgi:hypothetical protein
LRQKWQAGGTSRLAEALLITNKKKVSIMFLQLGPIRTLIHRYLRRFVVALAAVDAARLTRRLEARVPPDLKGPATRAILHNLVTDLARRHGAAVSG